MFNDLPVEMLLQIFSFLTPESILNAMPVNKHAAMAFDMERVGVSMFWRGKFERHFPHHFRAMSNQKEINWYAAFRKYYEIDYAGLSVNYKNIFSLVKEGDIKELESVNLQWNDLYIKDKSGTCLLDWSKKRNNQAMLDYFYQLAIQKYSFGFKVKTELKDEQNRTILYWAIVCHQSPEKISLLLMQGSSLHEEYYQIKFNPVHIAVQEGQFDIVKMIIESHPESLQEMDSVGQTVLLWAAAKGHVEMVAYLVKKGANLNAATNKPGDQNHGKTALYWALQHGHHKVVDLLVNAGANVATAVGNKHLKPVHLAAEKGSLEIVKSLIENDPQQLEQLDTCGQTPLIWAAATGHEKIVEYLISKGANLNIASHKPGDQDHGKTPLYWAVQAGYNKVVEVLLKAGAEARTAVASMQFQAIHIASQKGKLDIVKALIESYPQLLEEIDVYGQTPLLWASANGHADLVAYLISKRANLNTASNRPGAKDHRKTPLHWAVERGHSKVVKLLVKAGAYTNTAADYMRYQPVHLAAQKGLLDIVKTLIESQPQLLEQMDAKGQTPLLWAAANGHADLVDYFISKGANLNVATRTSRDKYRGKTTFYWAVEGGDHRVISLLLKAGAKTRTAVGQLQFQAIHLASQEGQLKTVKMLIKEDPELLEQTDKLGRTSLFLAAENGHADIVAYLISEDANLNVVLNKINDSNHGRTALYVAAEKGYSDVVHHLLKHGLIPDNDKSLSKNKLTIEVKNQINLVEYISKKKGQKEPFSSFTIFGHTFKLRYTNQEKLQAATELQDYIFEADPALIDQKKQKLASKQKVLNDGGLGKVARKLM